MEYKITFSSENRAKFMNEKAKLYSTDVAKLVVEVLNIYFPDQFYINVEKFIEFFNRDCKRYILRYNNAESIEALSTSEFSMFLEEYIEEITKCMRFPKQAVTYGFSDYVLISLLPSTAIIASNLNEDNLLANIGTLRGYALCTNTSSIGVLISSILKIHPAITAKYESIANFVFQNSFRSVSMYYYDSSNNALKAEDLISIRELDIYDSMITDVQYVTSARELNVGINCTFLKYKYDEFTSSQKLPSKFIEDNPNLKIFLKELTSIGNTFVNRKSYNFDWKQLK